MRRLARVVRHWKRLQLQFTDGKRAVAIDEVDLQEFRRAPGKTLEGAVCQPDRQTVLARELVGAGDMIAMLVGDKDPCEIARRKIQPREPPLGFAHWIAAVEHHTGAILLDHERIAPAAATQAGETHALFQLVIQQR